MIVADDSVLMREGVTRLLEGAGFEVVGHDHPHGIVALTVVP